MATLDLHGVRHQEADEVVQTFLNFVELPCYIITGNSQEMKKIVVNVVQEYGWFHRERDSYNYGTLIIMENRI